jgi:hypothetical protein
MVVGLRKGGYLRVAAAIISCMTPVSIIEVAKRVPTDPAGDGCDRYWSGMLVMACLPRLNDRA